MSGNPSAQQENIGVSLCFGVPAITIFIKSTKAYLVKFWGQYYG